MSIIPIFFGKVKNAKETIRKIPAQKLGHCDKCGKHTITICIPCALRMRDEAIRELLGKKYEKN